MEPELCLGSVALRHWTERRRGEYRLHMQDRFACVAEAVSLPRWHGHRLSGDQRGAFFGEPYLGLASEHGQNLLDCMQVGGRSAAWVTPLLEDAQAISARLGGNAHPREHAWPPLLSLLPCVIDDLHNALRDGLCILLPRARRVSRARQPRVCHSRKCFYGTRHGRR